MLAAIHHPDKNGGSKKSEETFKVILNAYETLTDRQKRTGYDLKYKQYFQQEKSETAYKNNANTKHEVPKQPPPIYRENQRTEKTKSKVNYGFWIVLVLLALLYLYNTNKTTTTGNSKADKQLEQQTPQNRPQSGELDFKK